MKLDVQTLFFSMWLTVTLTGAALLLGVSWRRASGIRAWIVALWLQSIGWACLISAFKVWPRELSTIGATAIVASLSCMAIAVQSYLRRPVAVGWLVAPPAVTLVVHWFVFSSFVARIALVNGILGIQMLCVAWLLLRPRSKPFAWRWRWLAGLSLSVSGPLVLGRVAIAVFSPAEYPAFDSSHWLNVAGIMFNTASLTIGTLALLLAHRDEAEQELTRLATHDGLTGLLNRHTLMQRAASQVQLALRHRQALALWMLDLDHFKEINDLHGHQTGDRVIALFAQALKQTARDSDLVGRYGGEEFCVLMTLSDPGAVPAIDARLRDVLSCQIAPQLGFSLGFSAGAATLVGPGDDLEKLLERADRALYDAKAKGRGRLELAASYAPADSLTNSTIATAAKTINTRLATITVLNPTP